MTDIPELERLLAEATELKAQGRSALYICKCILILDALPSLIAAARELEALKIQPMRTGCDECLEERDRLTAENEHLHKANLGLATEAERLRSGLRFYAHGQHMVGFEDWEDGADPESPSWCCPPDESSMMVEDGGCARMVLAGVDPDWDGEPPLEHSCEPVMVKARAALAGEGKP